MFTRIRCWILLTIVSISLSVAPARAQDARKPVRLTVDMRDATKHIFHAKLMFPAAAGPLTLVYPKWIPGEHSPVGPIVNLTGLFFRAGGKEIEWRRDDADMFAFHCQIPAGANELEVSLDYISPSECDWRPGKSFRDGATGNFELVHRAPLSARSQKRRSNLHGQLADAGRMETWDRASSG